LRDARAGSTDYYIGKLTSEEIAHGYQKRNAKERREKNLKRKDSDWAAEERCKTRLGRKLGGGGGRSSVLYESRKGDNRGALILGRDTTGKKVPASARGLSSQGEMSWRRKKALCTTQAQKRTPPHRTSWLRAKKKV